LGNKQPLQKNKPTSSGNKFNEFRTGMELLIIEVKIEPLGKDIFITFIILVLSNARIIFLSSWK
jgi:hypothetical protein